MRLRPVPPTQKNRTSTRQLLRIRIPSQHSKLMLTEAGERFLLSIRGHLEGLQGAIAEVSDAQSDPAGILKISIGPTFGIGYILPMLPEFMRRYPLIRPERIFENRQVDLIAEGYDVAIGGGFELAPGVVARTLAPAHPIPVASPDYLRGRSLPLNPKGLADHDRIVMKSLRTGRITQRSMRNAAGEEQPASLKQTIVVNDPAAMRSAALMGLGVTMIVKADALSHLKRGELVRLLPSWWVDAGPISLYYASKNLLPSKTRVFIDFVAEVFQKEQYPTRFAGRLG